jgi:hypothetical protein
VALKPHVNSMVKILRRCSLRGCDDLFSILPMQQEKTWQNNGLRSMADWEDYFFCSYSVLILSFLSRNLSGNGHYSSLYVHACILLAWVLKSSEDVELCQNFEIKLSSSVWLCGSDKLQSTSWSSNSVMSSLIHFVCFFSPSGFEGAPAYQVTNHILIFV